MENFKKERLLALIEKKDEAFSTYASAYEWLEELDYLFLSLKSLGTMANKILGTIKSLRDTEFEFSEDINLIKAQLEVFKRYEFWDIEFK